MKRFEVKEDMLVMRKKGSGSNGTKREQEPFSVVTVLKFCVQDDKGDCHDFTNLELAWQPEKGEMVEVKAARGWEEREFLCMYGDKYVCRDKYNLTVFCAWGKCRPIKQTMTITLEDGTKVEISKESHEELAKAAKGG